MQGSSPHATAAAGKQEGTATMTEGTTPGHPWGRVDDDGTVHLRLPDGGERTVGQWAAGEPEAGLAFFERKFADLKVEVDLAERRLRDGKATPDQTTSVIAKVRGALVEPAVVGDIATLTARLDALDADVVARRAAVAAERAAAREQALAARETIVTEAESLAESSAWKATGDRFRVLLDQWKAAPRAERAKEQDLWKRFSTARSTFDKHRRQHFATLDAERKAAMAVKETIVTEAEALATSREWGESAAAYRDLMTRWKAAPRGPRLDEDRLWGRFRAAQDAFFAARNATFDERDAGLRENLTAKQVLLVEAEALLPVTDLQAAKTAIRSIAERWEKVGHVPRNDKDRLESRLRAVEESIRHGEADEWRRTDPAARARAEDTVAMFHASVAKLEKAAGSDDARKASEAQRSLEMTRPLAEAAERALAEFQR